MDKIPLSVWVDREIIEALDCHEKSPTQIVADALQAYITTNRAPAQNSPYFAPGAGGNGFEEVVERKFAEFRGQMKIELTLLRERLEDLEMKNDILG